MHDDQIRGLLRMLETDRDPDPAFADALYDRVARVARAPRRSRTPFLLLAAALLLALAATAAVGATLLREPVVVEATPDPSGSSAPTADPTASTPASPAPSPSAEPTLAFEAPDGVLPPHAVVISRAPLDLRASPPDGEITGSVEAGERLRISGPLMVDGARWYSLASEERGVAGYVELDPMAGTVELEPVSCPIGAVDLAMLVEMTPWARLSCLGDRELTLEGREIVGFGGYRTGTYEPEWLNGFLGEFALDAGNGNGFFVRVEPGTVDTTRPPATEELGALLRVTGHFNHPASTECRSTGIVIGEPDGPTADIEPIAAELECREQFVVTAFEVVDAAGGVVGGTVTTTADGIAIRADASADAAVVARVNAGQRLGVTGGPLRDGGMDWYEVRLGPGTLRGWIATGPDGTWLMRVSDGDLVFGCDGCGDAAGLYRASLDGASLTPITDDRVSDWAWSPDGSRLAAALLESVAGPVSIVVMDADGANRQALGEGYSRPSWSPDGTRLAWSDAEALIVTDGDLRPARIDLDTRAPGHVHWSPDGARIAYTAIDCPACPEDGPIAGDPPSGIWTVRTDGSDLRQVTGGDYSGLGGWSPDGSRLGVVLSDLSGEFPTRAYTIPAGGGERTFLLEGGAVLGAPAWSPDGTRMAFVTEEGLVVADGDGSNPRVVAASGETAITQYVWSPSGARIAYTIGGASDGSGVFVIGADGGQPRRLTPEGASANGAAWQPVLEALP